MYVILDRALFESPSKLLGVARAAAANGADIVQLRNKIDTPRQVTEMARAIKEITRLRGVKLIINDRPDIALASGADGVHVGQEDLPLFWARAILGKERIVGVSTHSLKEAKEAEQQGADYIGLGAIFATPTKPEVRPIGMRLIAKVLKEVRIPVVAIGGINRDNVTNILDAASGMSTKFGVAVVRAVCKAEDPSAATRQLKELIVNRSEALAV